LFGRSADEARRHQRMPQFIMRFILRRAARQSLILRALFGGEGTFLDGITTYVMKLGAEHLPPPFDSPIDRRFAASPHATYLRLRTQQMATLIAAAIRRELDVAEVHHKKALALNPFDARIMALRSPLATYLGKPEEGRCWIEEAMRLDPLHPAWYATNLGLAHYCARDYAEGAAVYAGVPEPQAGVLAGLVACRAQLGDREGAARAREALLGARPDFSSRVFIGLRPFKYDLDAEHLAEGLRKGGLPA